MILSGEKREEYREIKPYYDKRFLNAFNLNCEHNGWDYPYPIIFRNGYSSSSPSFTATVQLTVGKGKPEWGAEPGKDYYVLKIMEIEKPNNYVSKQEKSTVLPIIG